jgi:hypothetical protein
LIVSKKKAKNGLGKVENNCFHKNVKAETFNSFYTTVVAKLVEKLPDVYHRYSNEMD